MYWLWYLREEVRTPLFVLRTFLGDQTSQGVHSRPLQSSTFPQTSTPRSPTVIPQMPSSSTVYPHQDQARSSVSSAQTVSERVPLSKSLQESSSPTSVATMYAQLTAFPLIAYSLYSGSPRLARNLEVLPWIRTSKLLHESA